MHNTKQGKDQSLTVFVAYITNTAQGTQISDYDKCVFRRTRICPEIHMALPGGAEHPPFNALLEACL
jgi:hypothetical protein